MYTLRLLLVFLLMGISLNAYSSFVLYLNPHAACSWEEYDRCLPSSFVLADLGMKEENGRKDLQELFTQVGIIQGDSYQREELKRLLTLLQKVPKLKTIVCFFEEEKAGAWRLYCEPEYDWTFLKVVFSGSLIGKERYRQYYLHEPYEKFDENKHAKSCHEIVKVLQEKGYKDARVIDAIVYDDVNKTVTTHLHLDQGPRFTVRSCEVVMSITHSEQLRTLAQKVQKRLNTIFKDTYYDCYALNKEVQKAKEYILRKGYVPLKITVDEKKYPDNNLQVILNVQLSSRKIEFCGNEYFTSVQLIENLSLLEPALGVLPPTIIVQEIEKFYRKKGFWEVSLKWYEDNQYLIITITEGARVEIKDVIFQGINGDNDDITLLKGLFFNKIIGSAFDEELIKQAYADLVHHYTHQGFWDFAIVHEEYDRKEAHEYVLVLTVEQGEQRLLKRIEFSHFQELAQVPRFAHFSSEKPAVFPAKLLEEQRQFLVQWLMEKGYLYVMPEAQIVQEEGGFAVIWHFKGLLEPVTFGKTIICKDSRFPAAIIAREIEYKEKQPWNKTARDQTIARLKALEIFDNVSLTPLDIFTPESSKSMLLMCSLDDPFELKTRLGFQLVGRHFKFKAITFKWGISALWKNPTFNADQLRFDVDVNRYMREVAASYKIPWLFNKPLKSVFKLYSIRYDQPIAIGSRQTLYQENKEGLLVSFQKNYAYCNQGINSGFEWIKISSISSQSARQLDFEPRLVNTYIPYLFGENTLFIDYLDNKVQPTYGSLSVISGKLMIPLKIGHTFYFKLLAEQSFFVPLYHSLIFGFRLRFGHIFNRQFSALLPPERFYLGGAYSVRGYEQDQVPPLTYIHDDCNRSWWVPLGGKSMVNINVELRFPFYRSIGGVLFYDGGTLNQDSCALIQPSNFSSSLGFGLRYNSPVGALRFDIGWKLRNKFSDDCSFAWFLTLGQAF